MATFNGANGTFPTAGLVCDAQGNLFGTTSDTPGGPNDFGTVFELSPVELSPVPEPSSLVLMGLGMVGVAGLALRARARIGTFPRWAGCCSPARPKDDCWRKRTDAADVRASVRTRNRLEWLAETLRSVR